MLAQIIAQCPPPGYPPPGDGCPQAPTLCTDLNGYCATLGTNNVQQPFPGCPANALNNDEWFAFIAGSSVIDIEVVPSNCQGTNGQFGMQGAIYEGGCDGTPVATQCNCVDATFIMSGNYIPGQVYYVVFDGCAGDICDFQVNVIQGSTLPIPPENPSPINGPTQVCPGATTTYFLSNPNAATFNWTMNPAIGSISGSPGGSIDITWNSTGTTELCVTSSNPCFLGGTTCINITSSNLAPSHEYYNLCVGDCVPCAGTTFCSGTGPAGTPVTLQNYLGCDSVVFCHITQIPAIVTNLGMVTLCAPSFLTICGQQYTNTEIISHTCTNANWQGCDSTVNVDLAILDPQVLIEPPGVIGCGVNSEITLVATNSNFSQVPGGTMTMLWTGPGILGPANGPTVTINQAGQYCFTITTSRNNVVCTDQECVTVTSNIQTPQMPQITGNQNPCQGTTVNYTISPVGNPPPTGYTIITPNNEPVNQINPTTYAVTWTTSAGGQLCVTADNDCGSSPPSCIPITVSALPSAPQMTGPTTVCANNQTQTYTVSPVQNGVTYNWTVPTGATFTGSGASISVNFNNAMQGPGQVCVTAQNNCGNSTPTCVNLTITGVPATPTMTGPGTVCTSGGNYTYVVGNPPPGITYAWTAPNGATITGTGASVDINFNGASTGQVCVTAQNTCGNSQQVCQPVTVLQAPNGTISGAGAICQGSNDTVSLTLSLTGSGPWDVSYSLNNGPDIDINGITTSPYTFSVTQAGTYTLTNVSIANSTCAGTTNGSATVTQNPAPVATLTGGGAICEGSGQTVPLSIAFTGTSPWTINWTLNGNAQAPFQATTNPYIWNIGEGQEGTIAVTDVMDGNGCDGTANGTSIITVNDAPTVSNLSADCDPNNQFFTVIFTINGGDPGSYSVTPLNGAISGNTFTSNPIPSGNGYSFVVTDANDCAPVTLAQNAVVCDCESAVGQMDANPIEVCGNGPATGLYDNTGQNFDGNDVLFYVLHSGSGLSIVPPIFSTSALPDVSFEPTTMAYGTTYYLSAVVGDSDGANGVDLNDPCLQVAQGTPVIFREIPTAQIGGAQSICVGDNAQITVQFTGVAPWGISYDDGSGNIQTLTGITQNPYPLDVAPTATSTICLTGMNDVNCPGTVTGCATITVNTGVTVSNLQVDCNATSTAYTITFDITGGDPSSYTVTGVNGTLTGNTFTSVLVPSGTGYSIVVDDVNSCQPQTLAQTIVDCQCETDAGTMAASPTVVVCGNGPAVVSASIGTAPDADDIIRYVLRPDNFAQIGTIIASSDVPSFSLLPGMTYGTTYYVSAVAGNDDGTGNVDLNDPCFDLSTNATPIVFYEPPTASLSGSGTICEGSSINLDVELTGAGPWTLSYQDGSGGLPLTASPTGNPFSLPVSPSATTTYTLVNVSNQFCPGTVSGTATISVTNPPTASNIVETCDATGLNYVVSFTIQGGDATSYTVGPNGAGTLVGNVFTSNPLTSGSSYAFLVDDVNVCGPTVVDGAYDCNCISSAGTMSAVQLNVCVGNTVTAPTANNPVLDGNDILVYYLHTGNSNDLGTVIANSPNPTFNFNPATMTTGVVYYISSVVGNNSGIGTINLNDPCLSVAVGTPVVFNALPTVAIAGTTTICEGESAQLTLTLTGVGPFTVNFQLNGVDQTQIVPTPGTIQLPAISTNTTILLSAVTDNGTGCSNTSSQSASVTVNANVSAGTSNGNLSFCQGTGQAFDLDNQLTGASPGGQWTGPGGVVPGGQLNPVTLNPGTFQYVYTVQGVGNCPDDDETVVVTITAAPTADAGPDQLLTCDVLSVQLGGPNTTPGAVYSWEGGPVSSLTTPTTITTQPGTYTLTVDNQGCTATDEVEVDQSADVPELFIVISDVSCFGNSDGLVSVDSVAGGVEPYSFSLNGGPFGSISQFDGLGPGSYEITVIDANGCETPASFTVTEPQEVTVEIVGNFEGDDPIIDLGDNLVLSILSTPSSGQLDTIIWSTQGLDSCATCPEITVAPTQQTVYTVQVNEDGCSASDDITVLVEKKRPVYVPNAFSPNDDGLNDIFTIYASDKIVSKVKSFIVFNRWGETVYQYKDFIPSLNPTYGWDGRLRGKVMQPAVFTWFAELEFIDGRIEVFKGDVTLIR